MADNNRQSKFFQLFSSIRGKQALKSSEKQVRLTQRTVLEKNLNTMLANESLWSELVKASFKKEKAGEVGNVIKLDSAYDRFGTGLTFAGDDQKGQFGKVFMPALRSIAALTMQLTFADLRAADEADALHYATLTPEEAEATGTTYKPMEFPSYNALEKDDQQLALEVLGGLYGFGTTLYKTPASKLVAADKWDACKVASQGILRDFFGK